jgi:PAS domain S-box-containing protein
MLKKHKIQPEKPSFNCSILLLLIFLFYLFSFTACTEKLEPLFDIYTITSYREIPGVTAEEITAIEALKSEGRSLSMGKLLSTEEFMLPDGSYGGFSPKLNELLSYLFGIPFVLEFYDLGSLMSGLDDFSIDLTCELVITPERQSRYNMSSPISQRSVALVTYGDRNIHTLRDLSSLRVGILERSSVWEFIANSYPDLEFTAVTISSSEHEADMLRNGEIDAIISISTVLTHDYSGSEFTLVYGLLPLAYSPAALSTANPKFAPIISVMNKYLAAGGLDKLYEMYKTGEAEYKKNSIRQILSENERTYIDSLKGKVPVVLGTDTYPVSFFNENEDEFQGIAIDVLTEISRMTGIEFEVINDKNASWGEILEMLRTGDAALISDLIITEERKEYFIWSNIPYFSTPYAFFSKLDYPNLELYQIEQKTVAIVDWCATHELYNQWFPNNSNVILYNSQDEALDALENNEVNLFFNLGYILYYQKNYREKPNYKANYSFPVFNDIFFGLNKNEEALRSIISKTISYIDTEKISYDWTSRSFDYSRALAQARVSYLTVFVAVLLLVLIIIISLLVNITQQRRVISIQSRDIKKIDNLLRAVNHATNVLLTADENEDFKSSLLQGMEIVGNSVDTDCIEVWQNEMIDGELCAVIKHYWHSNKEMYQSSAVASHSFPYSATPDWDTRMAKGECIHGPISDLLPEDQDFIRSFGITSMLAIPVIIKNRFWGICCIDDYTKYRTFSEDEIDILRSCVLLFVNSILRNDMVQNIRDTSSQLEYALIQATDARNSMEKTFDTMTSVLNKSDIMIYVTDIDTDEILFMNDYMKQQYKIEGDVIGQRCYELLQSGMTERCDFCPCHELDKEPEKVITWEECSTRTKKHYRKTDRYIDWPGGKKVHIQHSVDITELITASEHIRIVFENAPVGLTIFDENLKFIDCNEAVLKLYGLTKEAYSDYFGSSSHSPEFQPDGSNSHDKSMEIVKRVMDGEMIKFEWVHYLPDGNLLPVELTLTRMASGDKFVGLSYLYDMREQIRLREEIEKRKEAESMAGEHFKIMLDSMPLICNLWSKDGKIFDCNETAFKLYGCEDKESYFKNFTKLSPEIQPDGITTTAEIAARELKKVFEEGKTEFEYTAQRLDGTPLPQHVTLTRVHYKGDYIAVGYGRDLRKRKQMAAEIEVMFENAPVGLTVFDENFQFIDCNEAVLKIYGVTREFYSNFFGSASHSPEYQPDGISSRDKAMEVIKRVMDGETMRIEWVHCLPDGQPLPVELTMTRVIKDDKFVGLGYIYDMREQIRLKKEVEDALVKSQEASRAKSNFLSIMSHEMRTPMNAIIGMTTIGKKADNIEGKNHALSKIVDASSHLLGVISDVLDMAKIEANKLELSPVEFNFERMVQRVMTVINFRVDEKDQELSVNLDKNIPNFLVGDDQRLAQVITNLLSNAVKFTPEGGKILMDVSLLGETDDNCEICIEVTDNGIGIAPEHHEKLFDMFEQAESGISREYGGTGLGLVISKNIIELTDGKIWVQSELGKGTKFSFTVKMKLGTKNPRSMLSPGVNWDNVRVLIVDDDKEIHRQFDDIFSNLDLMCDTALDGYDACRMIEEQGEYDIYFVDWRMPGMDGIELTKIIKSRKDGRPSVVIMITAMDWEQVKEAAASAGVDKHLLKPLFPSMVIDSMNECFGVMQIQDAEHTHGELEGKRLLLAEDIEINREIVLALLEDTGLHIDWVENVKEALDAVESSPGKYDIIFMDVQMPKMDGLEATRHIRELEAKQKDAGYPRIPIIAMTANVFKDDIEACLAAGMDNHLGKPLDIDKVMETLHIYLKT